MMLPAAILSASHTGVGVGRFAGGRCWSDRRREFGRNDDDDGAQE